MTFLQRTRNFITAIIMIALSVLMLILPDLGFIAAAVILSISLVLYGLRNLVFYFSMARHMVGGRGILYIAIIVLDLGIFTLTILDSSRVFIMLYLLLLYIFSGAVDILRAFEEKRNGLSSWKYKLSYGIINISIAVIAFLAGAIFKSRNILVYIYTAGLIYSALMRIITSFKRSAIVYIQ